MTQDPGRDPARDETQTAGPAPRPGPPPPPQPPYRQPGHPAPPHSGPGHPQPGHPQPGYPAPGSPPPGPSGPGYSQAGYPQPGPAPAGHLPAGYPGHAYPSPGRPPSGRRNLLISAGVAAAVVLVIALVVGLVVWTGDDDQPSRATATSTSQTATDPGAPHGTTPGADPVLEYLVGKDGRPPATDPKVVVTVVSDYQCPACKVFDVAYSSVLDEISDTEGAAVRYIPISFLDRMSTDDYSSRAWNASVCVANSVDPSRGFQQWLAFHRALFRDQPTEGGPGLSNDTLLALSGGPEVDVAGADSCIRNFTYRSIFAGQASSVFADLDVQGTPGILIDDTVYEPTTPSALKQAVQDALRG